MRHEIPSNLIGDFTTPHGKAQARSRPSNARSQILNGSATDLRLKARPNAAAHGGFCMSPEDLAVLRSLAIRPSASIAPSILPFVTGLQQAGYVTQGPSGWIATAKGCELVERQRPGGALSPARNQP